MQETVVVHSSVGIGDGVEQLTNCKHTERSQIAFVRFEKQCVVPKRKNGKATRFKKKGKKVRERKKRKKSVAVKIG